jgi:hypothetical protein
MPDNQKVAGQWDTNDPSRQAVPLPVNEEEPNDGPEDKVKKKENEQDRIREQGRV